MDTTLINDILDLFIPFSVQFAITLYLCEFIFRFIVRLAFARISKNDYIV